VPSTPTNTAGELPSIKLFQRMTVLKRDKTVLEDENVLLKGKIEELLAINQNLNREIQELQEKIETYDHIL
jgi:predicted transglutaminase-like cysteine proteinase